MAKGPRLLKDRVRTCIRCKVSFNFDAAGVLSNTCPICREQSRNKVCKICSQIFHDDSPKNTRKACLPCALPAPREIETNPSLQSLRIRRSERGNCGSIINLKGIDKSSQTWRGRVAELLFLSLFPDSVDVVASSGNHSPYDLWSPALGRVNVKSSCQRVSKHGLPIWRFSVAGCKINWDTGFFVGFSTLGDPERVVQAWVIPSSRLGDASLDLSPSSREYLFGGHEVTTSQLQSLNRNLRSLMEGELQIPLPEGVKKTPYARKVLGRMGERLYAETHPTSNHLSRDNPSSLVDFQDEDGSLVEIKTCRPDFRRPGRWSFILPAGHNQGASTYFLIGMDPMARQARFALRIPSSEITSSLVCYREASGSKSKWHKYLVPGFPRGVVGLVRSPRERRVIEKMAVPTEIPRTLVEDIVRVHQGLGFPFPERLSREETAKELDDLAEVRWESSLGHVLPSDTSGLAFLSPFFPHRFRGRNIQADMSAFDFFFSDRLSRAVEFILASGRKVNSTRLRTTVASLAHTPTMFRPSVAKVLVEKYAGPGGCVLDPCAGWGGRMLGTLSAGRSYVGVEISPPTARGLVDVLGALKDFGLPSAEILCSPIQNANLPAEKFDFALTSPPYADQEVYEGSPSTPIDLWRTDFLEPLFQRVRGSLRRGGRFAVNISDVPRGRKILPLREITESVATDSGFKLCAIHTFRISRGSDKMEPVLVFQVP